MAVSTPRCCRIGIGCLLLVAVSVVSADAEKRRSRIRPSQSEAESVEMFSAMEADQIEVKFIAKSDKEANVIIKNKTDRHLNIELPTAFAGVPALAQFGRGGGGGGFGDPGGGFGGGGNNNNGGSQNQALGGGIGGGGLGGGGLGGGGLGGGGGVFNIRPEQVAKIEVPCLCLEHGKENPRAKIPYEIRPLSDFTENEEVHQLVQMFATGKVNQRVAQAAAWHLSNELGWDELAAKEIRHLNGPSRPYFQTVEIQAAIRLAGEAKARAALKKENNEKDDSISRKLASH